jgi:two-component system CheB/CheR fusion protein
VPPPDLPDLSGLTLLIVDDHDDSLEMLGTFLRSCGAHVLEARNGPAALAYVDQRPTIDAVVTDLSMPSMDGVELVRQMRQRQPIPAIAVTGLYAQYAHTVGRAFDAFLRKPVNIDELCRVILSAVARGR